MPTHKSTKLEQRVDKRAKVVALISRPGGAAMAEITWATGWQPHSARANSSGLRKVGHAITLSKTAGGSSRYLLAEQD
jgi:hypothetical protein